MKLIAAIERLEIMVDMRQRRGYHHEEAALKLGIEALKKIESCRDDDTDINFDNPLLGETKE